MTPRQTTLIQESFARVRPIAGPAAALFYGRLFEIAPPLRSMFKRDGEEQGRMLMATLGTAVAMLGQPERFARTLENLGRGHAAYGVTAAHFEPVGQALLWALEQGLGDAFTDEVREAWTLLYADVAVLMQKGLG
jgi:hemoglobin-like flavoprotein